MLAKVLSYGLSGIDGYLVTTEVDISNGLPAFDVVGLGDMAIRESRERVRSSIKNSGFEYSKSKIIVNLAPADTKKEGPLFDLSMALGILSASNQIYHEKVKDYICIGELSLDGGVRRVNGLLPILISARKAGYKKFLIPFENQREASFIKEIDVYPIKSLREAFQFLNGEKDIERVQETDYETFKEGHISEFNFKYVKGQASAKRALEIAAAGGHNVIMIGPPGSGKTMLAKCFPSILPDMTFEEALDVTKIHSVSGALDNKEGIICKRPFRSPHHTATLVSLTGGGKNSKPGEISLAHHGVLFLDEMPEYDRQTIEALRQPLEDRKITVARANQTLTYPADFILIASMNPCPCGYYGSKLGECKCTPIQIHKYLSRLSGPLLDRIDIHIEVDNVTYNDLTNEESNEENSLDVKKRVNAARTIQIDRLKNERAYSNASMSVKACNKYCALDRESHSIMRDAFDKLKLSARAYNRILRVARTIADLENCDNIKFEHIAEAIQYRSLDKKYWS